MGLQLAIFTTKRMPGLPAIDVWRELGPNMGFLCIDRSVGLVSSNTKWRPSLLVRFDYLPVWFPCRADEFSFYFGHCTGKDNSSWGTCSCLRKGRGILVVFPMR